MDPITAVGFAAGILQFIEFSWGVITGTYEVYKSTTGTTHENAHISTVVNDLERATDSLISDVERKTKNERELFKLADKCHELSQDLSKILKKLQASEKNSKWLSLKVKVASMRKEKDIASIEDRLDRYRSQILVRLNFMLCEQQSSVKVQLDKIQKEGVRMSTETSAQLTCLRQELNQAVKALLETKDNARPDEDKKKMYSAMDICSALLTLQSMSRSLSRENQILRRLYFDNIYAREDTITDAESGTLKWILEEDEDESIYSIAENDDGSFYSTEEDDRELVDPSESSSNAEGVLAIEETLADEDEVQDREKESPVDLESGPPVQVENEPTPGGEHKIEIWASGNTPKSPPDAQEAEQRRFRTQTRDSFLAWLGSGNQIYHISGKAGSGKSTLMKFLCQHSRVRKELESWAAEKRLVFAQFFFWNSGEKLQTSLEGLYRSLLFETLKQYPGLIPEIFPEEWDALDSAILRFESPSFRIAEIKAAFDKLISKWTFPKHRLCFFIDGLDEYEGDSLEHWELANSLRNWASSTDIKICVSSRPHTEFMHTFSDSPNFRLRLHELTRADISRFASAMFEKDTNFDRVKDMYTDLVRDIVETANGVFLWARLVVRSLLEGVGHHDSQPALQEKLNSIPKELDELFAKLLGTIKPSDRKRSDQMLYIATGDPPGDSVNALAYSWLEDLNDPNFPFSSPTQGYSDEEIKKRHSDLRPQLDSLSKGLLEMVPDARAPEDIFFGYKVQFFHRTVKDYLRDDSRQRQFQGRLPDFNLGEVYLRLSLAELKFVRTKQSYFGLGNILIMCIFESCHRYWKWKLKWHLFLSKEGRKAPFNFAKEASDVLNSYRQLPFSHPEEIEVNSGSILWGTSFRDDEWGNIYLVGVAEFSYLHFAAWYSQHEYVTLKLSEDPNLAKGNGEMTLLLSASFGDASETVRVLLQAGADPQDQVTLEDQPNPEAKTATVWMLFLFYFASSAVRQASPFEQCSLVLEEYLKFGVDTDIFFLISNPGELVVSQNEREITSRGKEKSEPPKQELFSISLEDLVSLRQPKNVDALQTLLRDKAKQPFWKKTSSVISKFLPWIEPSNPIPSQYNAFEPKELGQGLFALHSVCSKTCQLEKGFSFRIY